MEGIVIEVLGCVKEALNSVKHAIWVEIDQQRMSAL